MQQKIIYIDPKLNKHKKNWLHSFNGENNINVKKKVTLKKLMPKRWA
jgi:hypothetical protein